jgi:5-methylcytosine-specific restriction protein B
MAKDFTKYIFEGKKYSKGRLVLAVVRQYVAENPNVTYSELREIFSGEDYKGDVLIDTADYQQWKSNRKDNQDRFFMANGISLADGTVVYISNQWTVSWMNLFLENVKRLGYSIVAENHNGTELEQLFQKYLKNPRKKWIENYRTRAEGLVNEIRNNTGEFSEEFLSTFWREGSNGVSSVGQGALSHEEFRSVKDELTNLLRDIHVDPSPNKFDEVMVWVKNKVKKQHFRNQKHAVVRRIFASISPENYTTVTEKRDLNSRLKILSETYGIKKLGHPSKE